MCTEIAISALFVLAAIVQTWGAHLEKRPCKFVKYSYAVSLVISAGTLLYCASVASHSIFGYVVTLALLGFNILLGGTVRLVALLKTRRERRSCVR